MNAKLNSHNPAVATHDVFTTTLVPARRWIASAVAVVMTSLTLAVVSLPTHVPAVAWINGIHVTNLTPVEVTPTAADMKAAATLEHAAVGVANGAAVQLGAQLAMPYYSFGTTSASSKE
ncbi:MULTISPECIES: hypothetical protein [Rhodanobacter]|uniref:Uncharacterized protein n=1 Tax=Rhodanobacter hydrolyticus TaxID=2250595 RepID=A0ABW8J2J5_9GAMM|nr:hypothetical protein [Rhodanobacter sp. 7MK24]MBD8879715.1 hypothetical protein [Rhodanobacter sp. 7MK24]